MEALVYGKRALSNMLYVSFLKCHYCLCKHFSDYISLLYSKLILFMKNKIQKGVKFYLSVYFLYPFKILGFVCLGFSQMSG